MFNKRYNIYTTAKSQKKNKKNTTVDINFMKLKHIINIIV